MQPPNWRNEFQQSNLNGDRSPSKFRIQRTLFMVHFPLAARSQSASLRASDNAFLGRTYEATRVHCIARAAPSVGGPAGRSLAQTSSKVYRLGTLGPGAPFDDKSPFGVDPGPRAGAARLYARAKSGFRCSRRKGRNRQAARTLQEMKANKVDAIVAIGYPTALAAKAPVFRRSSPSVPAIRLPPAWSMVGAPGRQHHRHIRTSRRRFRPSVCRCSSS